MKTIAKARVNVWLAVAAIVIQTLFCAALLRRQQSEIRQLTAELVRMNQMQR